MWDCNISYQAAWPKCAFHTASSSLLSQSSIPESPLWRGSNPKWLAKSPSTVISYCFHRHLWTLMTVARTCLHVCTEQTKCQLKLASPFHVATCLDGVGQLEVSAWQCLKLASFAPFWIGFDTGHTNQYYIDNLSLCCIISAEFR